MTMQQTRAATTTRTPPVSVPLHHSSYKGATGRELALRSRFDRLKAVISQQVLFPHRGRATLYPDRLELDHWDPGRQRVIERDDIDTVEMRFTRLYGRFLGGGIKRWGAPVILHLTGGEDLYLLFNHRDFVERTDDRKWTEVLRDWHDRR